MSTGYPDEAAALFAQGNRAFDSGNYSEAAAHYGAYTRLRPGEAQGFINLGLCFMRTGDWQRARGPLERAVALAPDRPKPPAMLAYILEQLGVDWAERIPTLRRATTLDPGNARLQLQLAEALFGADQTSEARGVLRKALELDPHNPIAQWLDFQLPDHRVAPDQAAREAYLARWRAGIARFLAIDWHDPKFAAQANATLAAATNFYLAYLGLPLVAEHRQYGAVVRRMVRAAAPDVIETVPRRIGKKRRKVAIASPHLRWHSTNRVWCGALQALDPALFELGVFHLDTHIDSSTEQWRSRADRFECGERSANQWIDALRSFDPDVLVYLDIGPHNMMQVLPSLRLAPVQVTTWGHPVTSGMPMIDYFLSADACEPPDGDAHYSEKLVRLPRLGTFLQPPAPPLQRVASNDGKVRLLCVQSIEKLHPGHDDLFARILAAVPNATLDILTHRERDDAQALAARLRGAFVKAGVDVDTRCRVHPRLSIPQYQEFLARADACLDSLDFSGCLSSLDTLWQDLPIVTLPGALMRGRQTYGMLALLGLDELIARDADDYVHIATRLAQDADWRASLSARIAAGKASLYQDHSVVQALAQFLGSVEPSDSVLQAAGNGLGPAPTSHAAVG